MTLPYERKSAVNRAHKLLVDILCDKYEEAPRGGELWNEASRVLKHFPGDYYMEDAARLAPEIFGKWRADEKLTEIVVDGTVHTAPEGYCYIRVLGDDETTINYALRKKS